MELEKTILGRRSVRKYTDEKISDESVKAILEAGLIAASGRNLRPTEFIVVEDKDILEKLSMTKTSGSDFLKNAVCAVVVIGDTSKSDTWVEDGSVAMAQMMLKATDLGIGSCWVQCRSRFSKEETEDGENLPSNSYVRRLLGIPEQYDVLSILSLGMAQKEHEARALSDADFNKVHREKF